MSASEVLHDLAETSTNWQPQKRSMTKADSHFAELKLLASKRNSMNILAKSIPNLNSKGYIQYSRYCVYDRCRMVHISVNEAGYRKDHIVYDALIIKGKAYRPYQICVAGGR
jgi:hypothetical protein